MAYTFAEFPRYDTNIPTTTLAQSSSLDVLTSPPHTGYSLGREAMHWVFVCLFVFTPSLLGECTGCFSCTVFTTQVLNLPKYEVRV